MTDKIDFLVEIGSEELPPKALKQLSAAFEQGICDGLTRLKLSFDKVTRFATPRRLAVIVHQLDGQQATISQQRLGPAVQAAYDKAGKPTPAATGFAKSCGVEVSDLEEIDSPKGKRLGIQQTIEGKKAVSLLPDIVEQALGQLPIPRLMRWGASDRQFVRPVHWVLMLADDQVIDGEILGIASAQTSYGHRFHHSGPVVIEGVNTYAQQLHDAKVMVSFEQRQDTIRAQVHEEANKLSANAIVDTALLDEVTALVEWPVAITGCFDEAFLKVPSECLISAMQEHQKYFPLTEANNKRLLPRFITISNIDSRNPASVISGNEKVIRPRLADAMFFYESDCKTSLESRVERLESIVFQQKLGTLKDKCQRMAEIGSWIIEHLEGSEQDMRRAALLCKTDLVTQMVGEFPELQGIMGEYYALNDGENETVALAIKEHYAPRFSGDAVPTTPVSISLAIADKVDTLVGVIGIGQLPSGAKDPFGLRRAALGVLRLIIENDLELDLKPLVQAAIDSYDASTALPDDLLETVLGFFQQRFKAWYQDKSLPTKTINAVLRKSVHRPIDFERRIRAIDRFTELPESAALAAATKRVGNILRKENIQHIPDVSTSLLQASAEQALAAEIDALDTKPEGSYSSQLSQLASLKQPIDQFFDEVMVNVDDKALRQNRLGLLARLHRLLTHIADISELDT